MSIYSSNSPRLIIIKHFILQLEVCEQSHKSKSKAKHHSQIQPPMLLNYIMYCVIINGPIVEMQWNIKIKWKTLHCILSQMETVLLALAVCTFYGQYGTPWVHNVWLTLHYVKLTHHLQCWWGMLGCEALCIGTRRIIEPTQYHPLCYIRMVDVGLILMRQRCKYNALRMQFCSLYSVECFLSNKMQVLIQLHLKYPVPRIGNASRPWTI